MVDVVVNISMDNVVVFVFGMGFDCVVKVVEESVGFDYCNCFVQIFVCSFNDLDSIRIGFGVVVYVVGFVEIVVEVFVVESDIKVDNIVIKKNVFIGNVVVNNFVD